MDEKAKFSNDGGPVFALQNLDEVVKGALFARYSRSKKDLRTIYREEFNEAGGDAEEHAGALYSRVLGGFGDDSVAQLGSAHVSCEGVSNVLTKIIERGRLAAYLEQSTRYVPLGEKVDGSYRYHAPTELDGHPALKKLYKRALDGAFETYAGLIARTTERTAELYPRLDDEPEASYRRAVRSGALDLLRGLLPAATTANVGIHATGQSFEALIHRLLAHPLEEARAAGRGLHEAVKAVMPAFVERVDREDRGGEAIKYLESRARWTRSRGRRPHKTETGGAPADRRRPGAVEPTTTLMGYGPMRGDAVVLTAALYAGGGESAEAAAARTAAMTQDEIRAHLRDLSALRTNRRHKLHRAYENAEYRFEVVCDYGAFRDLQRHRMLTIDWQELGTDLGYVLPEGAENVEGLAEAYKRTFDACRAVSERMAEEIGTTAAQYACPMTSAIRFTMKMNAREACHMLELRTGPNGHPGYRRTCSEMHRLIAWIPQHKGIAESMKFVDHNRYELGRRRAEQRTEESRLRGAEPERRSGPEQEGSAEQQKENNDRVCPCCGFDKNDCRCCAGTAADRKRELKRIGAAPSPMRRRLRAEIDSG